MIQEVKLDPIHFSKYKGIIKDGLYDHVIQMAKKLGRVTVIHLNSTASGGGVSEILSTLVPTLSGLGIDARRFILKKHLKFFEITKEIHNFLQGKKGNLNEKQKEIYLRTNEEIANELRGLRADLWFLHDPQVAATISFHPNLHPSVWRSHIDTSKPNQAIWDWLLPHIKQYDRMIFTRRTYIGPGLEYDKCKIFWPAIDPLNPKNSPIDHFFATEIAKKFEVENTRPIISQISRFDPWKDPWGVIDAYRIAKKKINGLQLVLIGFFASDDPEAHSVLIDIKKYAGTDKDIHILSNLDGVGAIEVNAFQTISTVIIQKSIKEGFGLTVSEGMWKGKPVIGGKTGGIVDQIDDGKNGFLVSTSAELAEKIIWLISHPKEAENMGREGREKAREHFLMPRLIADHLKLYQELI